MNRHGVVVPREDGVRARCMGPSQCPECDKDMNDATQPERVKYLTDEVARRWSMPNADLSAIIGWVMRCTLDGRSAYDAEEAAKPLTLNVPLLAVPLELQCLAALAFVGDHFDKNLQADEMARAAGWLALRYGAMR